MAYTMGVMDGALNGAIYGAVAGVLLYPVFIVLAKRKQKTGHAMGKPVSREVHWPGSLDEALERGARVLKQLKADVVHVDRARGMILAGTGANLRTTGSTVHFWVQPAPGGFRVTVQAAPTMSLKDMGYSQQFVDRFIGAWMALGDPRMGVGVGDFVV